MVSKFKKLSVKKATITADKVEMKRKTNNKRRSKSTFRLHKKLDSHKWESKMEIHRLLSGKPDLKLKPDSQPTA